VERDGSLHTDYPLELPPASGNLYLMPPSKSAPSGKLINADDAILYDPMVLTDEPEEAFGDFPG
jgi:hypothetical protein